MEIDFKNDIIEFKKINSPIYNDTIISISSIRNVGIVQAKFIKVVCDFVYIQNDRRYYFAYSDVKSYDKLIRLISENRDSVRTVLLNHQNEYDVEHCLWKELIFVATKKYIYDWYYFTDEYGENTGLDRHNDFFNFDINADLYGDMYGSFVITEIGDVEGAYDFFMGLLPQNYNATKKDFLQQEAEEKINEIIEFCGNNFENNEIFLNELETQNGDDLEKWCDVKEKLDDYYDKIAYYLEEGIISDKRISKLSSFLEYCLNYVSARIDKSILYTLSRKYGSIGELKKSLRESINRLKFLELRDLYLDYDKKEKIICSKARQMGKNLDEVPVKDYIDVYRLGKIIISDRMNKISRNKAKNKYIPQDVLDEAVIFYYDEDSAEKAHKKQEHEEYTQNKRTGDIGEKKVEYALKWLDESYVQIKRKSDDKAGNKCILIKNPEFIDEAQEYDHIIVSDKAVIIIETKNYSGKIVIDKQGNWVRRKNGKEEGIKNPLQQIRQHEKLLRSIIPKKFKIVSVICIANDSAIIEGSDNCQIPIVKSDMLVEFIEDIKIEGAITEKEKSEIVATIYEYML